MNPVTSGYMKVTGQSFGTDSSQIGKQLTATELPLTIVESRLNKLSMNLRELSDTIERLKDRLQSVLTPELVAMDNSAKSNATATMLPPKLPETPRSAVTEQLDLLADQVTNETTRIYRLLERVEL